MTRDEAVHGDLLDVALRDEIELVSDLVVAASSSPRHFTTDEIDVLLGLAPASGTRKHDLIEPKRRKIEPKRHKRHR